MTMMYGYHYNEGKRVGYNITFNGFILHNVASSDKSRIVSEIKQSGYSKDEIEIDRVEN